MCREAQQLFQLRGIKRIGGRMASSKNRITWILRIVRFPIFTLVILGTGLVLLHHALRFTEFFSPTTLPPFGNSAWGMLRDGSAPTPGRRLPLSWGLCCLCRATNGSSP